MDSQDATSRSRDKGRAPAGPRRKQERKSVLLRLDPAVHEALRRWACDELRSVNAQIEIVLRDALKAAHRAPKDVGPLPRRGRPPRNPETT